MNTNVPKTDKKYIPDEIASMAHYFFSDQELHLAEVLSEGPLTDTEIEKAFGESVDGLLKKAYRREMVNKTSDDSGVIKYSLNPAGVVINNTAVFEKERWESLPDNVRSYITKWHYDDFISIKSTMSIEERLQNGNRVLPLPEIIEYLKALGDSFTIIPCDCHCKHGDGNGCDYTRNVCICSGHGLNSHADRGLGERKTLEETVELLHQTDKLGLIHSAENENICNCNVKYCYPMRASFDLDCVHQWPATDYCVELDREKCIQCGACVKRCQFGVFSLIGDGITADLEKCWGCGLCASRCPAKALSMKKVL